MYHHPWGIIVASFAICLRGLHTFCAEYVVLLFHFIVVGHEENIKDIEIEE
jgi:hypothetical protein